ncbi:MAG: hypothetical protein AABW89_05940 [Nanoarchaeota archaeon]
MTKCSICGDLIEEKYGNNAQPVNDGICCDKCNIEVVIPARLKKHEHEWKELDVKDMWKCSACGKTTFEIKSDREIIKKQRVNWTKREKEEK